MTTFAFLKIFASHLKKPQKGIDKPMFLSYNVSVMNNRNELKNRIPPKLIQEADNLSKETGIPFRDCLEVLYKAFLNAQPHIEEQVVWSSPTRLESLSLL